MPQIELMLSDLPHTLFLKKDGKGGVKISEDDVKDAEEKMREAYEKRRKAKEKEGYTVDELFAGVAER